MAGVGDAVAHDSAVAVDVVGQTPKAFHALLGRIGARAKMPFPIHPHVLRHGGVSSAIAIPASWLVLGPYVRHTRSEIRASGRLSRQRASQRD